VHASRETRIDAVDMNRRSDVDLGAYLERIGWTGSRAPTFATLAGILRAHVRRIPFEHLDVLLGRNIDLDLGALQDKLVRARRGGYCFEHATLFAAALEALGFAPVRHSARVVLVSPRTEVPRTHMLLTVALVEGTFVLDPGFGGLAPDVPVALDDAVPASGASHWMARDGAYWVLKARTSGKVVDCWATTLEADNASDFVVANHYTATHPASAFRNRLMLRAFAGDARVSVMNRSVTIADATTSRTYELADRRALRALLVEHFGFDLPEVETIRVSSIEEWQ
jgi:N-hydroxyarylamine O-acetyltransferase